MAIETVTAPEIPEEVLAGVPHDRRTPLGILLPHFLNNGRLDIERIAAALIMVDALVGGLPAAVDAKLAALVGAAPSTMDTIREIAAVLKDNPAVIDEILAAIGLRATRAELAAAVTTLDAAIGTVRDAVALRATTAALATANERIVTLETQLTQTQQNVIAFAIAL